MKKDKILVIRFSSIGDIWQTLSVVAPLAEKYEVHFLTKKEFAPMVKAHCDIARVFEYDKKKGNLIKLCLELRKERYTLLYDAHLNLRSTFVRLCLWTRSVIRSKDRLKRWLLFTFHLNLYKERFVGVQSFLAPLKLPLIFPYGDRWQGVPLTLKAPAIGIVASAAWPMKRWPLTHFKKLMDELAKEFPAHQFILFGSGAERDYLTPLLEADRCVDLIGKCDLLTSASWIKACDFIIANDSGLLHMADALGTRGIALMGPTAFGFTQGPQVLTAEVEMACRPCTKDGSGTCKRSIYQQCLVDLTPAFVLNLILVNFKKTRNESKF